MQYAGLVGVGLFQLNILIPQLPAGNHPTVVEFHGATSASHPMIHVR